ncbi:MAG: hypothetical protein RL077_3754 [Verrucomicrobiota bacterium]
MVPTATHAGRRPSEYQAFGANTHSALPSPNLTAAHPPKAAFSTETSCSFCQCGAEFRGVCTLPGERSLIMRKNFPLHLPGKADARVLDAIKNDIRKYVKRERRKPLPADFSLWRFDCKIGATETTADAKDLRELSKTLDQLAQTGIDKVYVEILAAADHPTPALVPSAPVTPTAPTDLDPAT